MYSLLKRLLLGPPLASVEERHQRLGKVVALAVFASDAISSTAYATEEILVVLVPAMGMAALEDLVPIALIVTVLLAIVVTSYRQTLREYPGGGGSYIVSRDNLGLTPSLVAGSALLIDYVLTVAVSVSAGVAAITSAYPVLFDLRVELCLVCVAVITVANLRGTKESGRLFAGPTYTYILALSAMVIIGLYRSFTGDLPPLPVDQERLAEVTGGTVLRGATLLLLLRAFSSGAVALSGVEAISNGVQAFRPPESRNAGLTLVWMATILGSLFFGISVLAHRLAPTVSESETLLSVMARAVFGGTNLAYLVLQVATFAILILAANTAYADFPRLSSIVAADGYLPRQLTRRGDRLVFSNGIAVLAVLAGTLLVVFEGNTSALIPLYAVGVFTGFTLSQAGMTVRHWRVRESGWRRGLVINATGALATFAVLVVVVVSKFTIGAWIPALVIPLLVFALRGVKRHYREVADQLRLEHGERAQVQAHAVVVLIGDVNRTTVRALAYARTLAADRVVALRVVDSDEDRRRVEQDWDQADTDIPLQVLVSPYRGLSGPVMDYLDELEQSMGGALITVVIPEFVVKHWYAYPLHNQTAAALRMRLHQRPNTVITMVPMHLKG